MRSAALTVLSTEVVYDEGFKFPLYVKNIMGNSKPVANPASIFDVIQSATALIIRRQVCLFKAVQLHGHAHHIVALTLQKEGGDGRVHAAAHGDNYLFMCSVYHRNSCLQAPP
jgi:hypothetical protein